MQVSLLLLIVLIANPVLSLAGGVGSRAKLERSNQPVSRSTANRTLLAECSRFYGDPNTVRRSLDQGADPNARDHDGKSALMHAAFQRNLECVRLLLDRGANPNLQDRRGNTPLMSSAYWSPLHLAELSEGTAAKIATLMLERGADPRVANKDGRTALMWAAGWRHPRILKLLLADPRVDIQPRDSRGRSALTWAARNGRDADTVRMLLERGANVGLVDALLLKDPDRAAALLESGGDIKARGPYDETTLTIAAENGDVKSVRQLIARGVDVNAKDRDGRTALIIGVSGAGFNPEPLTGNDPPLDPLADNRPEIVRLLVRAGAKLKMRVEGGDTAMSRAIEYGSAATVEALLDAGVRPNQRLGPWGGSALYDAAGFGRLETVKLLLRRGAKANVRNSLGEFPLHIAAAENHSEVIRALLQAGADVNARMSDRVTPLIWASSEETARMLIEHGADIQAKTRNGDTALTYAAWQKHEGVVRLLLERGVKPDLLDALLMSDLNRVRELQGTGDVKRLGPSNETALMLAAKKGYNEIVSTLIKRGADVEALDISGRNALMYAADGGSAESAELLLAAGALVDKKDRFDHEAALIRAVKSGKVSVIQVLLAHGADPNATDKFNQSALKIAKDAKNLAIARILESSGAK